MDVIYPNCCGLDVHKRTVVACLLTPNPQGRRRHKELPTFGTMTDDLLALADWLTEAGCTHVAMEATGAYWKPIYNILEGQSALLVVNAHHVKAVPGRKTDERDAEWIADLLQHGLLRGSFVPSRRQRELRELTRFRWPRYPLVGILWPRASGKLLPSGAIRPERHVRTGLQGLIPNRRKRCKIRGSPCQTLPMPPKKLTLTCARSCRR